MTEPESGQRVSTKTLGILTTFWGKLSVASLVAVVGACISWQGLENSREGDIVARLDKSAEQLGSAEIPVRLRGIQKFELTARRSPEDRWAIIELLALVVRDR